MQLPKLRLPSLSFGAGARAVLLYGIYTLLLFVVFLVATFPHELVLRQVMAAAGMARGESPIEIGSVKFAWWRGYRIDGLRLAPLSGGESAILELAHLWVRPTLRELVRGNPYALTVTADLYGGSAGGQVHYKDGTLHGDLAWDSLSLGRYEPLLGLLEEGQVSGRISGLLSFDAPVRNPGSTQAAGDVTIDAASVTGGKLPGFTLGDLSFKQAKLKFKASSGRVEVQEFNVSGDVNVQQVSGQIGLRDPVTESSLNLRANILQTNTTPDWLKTLISAIPRPAGAKLDAPLNITGTIAKPRFR